MKEFQNTDAQKILNETLPLLLEAGKIFRSVDHVGEGIAEKSGDSNFVTKYDVAVQNLLLGALGGGVPDACFFAEEKENNTLTDALTFIIDPIDGTTNFIRGLRHSCISVGVYREKAPLCGMIYNPYSDLLYFAVRGEGAYLADAPSVSGFDRSRRLSVPDCPLSGTLAVFGSDPYHKSHTADITLRGVRILLEHSLDIRRSGSAALDLAYVASGCYGIYFENCVSSWDYAAGRLIVTEAGGVVTRADGSEMPIAEVTAILAGAPTACKEFLSLMEKTEK